MPHGLSRCIIIFLRATYICWLNYLTVLFRISQACPGAVVIFAWRLTLAYARDVASVPLIGSKFPCPLLVTLLVENWQEWAIRFMEIAHTIWGIFYWNTKNITRQCTLVSSSLLRLRGFRDLDSWVLFAPNIASLANLLSLMAFGRPFVLRGKLNKVVGEVHSPNLPTNRLNSSLYCRKMRLSLSFINNTTFPTS